MSLSTGTTLKILSYNLWHGLSGEGTLSFGELEARERRTRRQKVQLELLKEQNADILFLQEVCPLYSRARELAKALKLHYVAHLDQTGVKFFGQGLPWNLNTGLVILARKELKLRNPLGIKLSGGPGFVSRFASIQLNEFRFALFAKITWRGREIQLINLHLHHGPVLSKALKESLDTFFRVNKEVSRNSVFETLERSRIRRFLEVQRLLRFVEDGHKVLGGDLNVEETDELLELFKGSGFKDLFFGSGIKTWESEQNQENHAITRKMKLTVPTEENLELRKILVDYDSRPRRIDYLMTTPEFRVESKALAMEKPKEGLIGSDHFGLSAVISL